MDPKEEFVRYRCLHAVHLVVGTAMICGVGGAGLLANWVEVLFPSRPKTSAAQVIAMRKEYTQPAEDVDLQAGAEAAEVSAAAAQDAGITATAASNKGRSKKGKKRSD